MRLMQSRRLRPDMLAQQLLNGLVVGGVYALFALGFTLVFGIHHLMNLAHGAVFMTGAFVALYSVLAGLPLWTGVLLAIMVCGLLSVLIEITAFRRLRKSGEAEFGAIISTLGADLIIMTFAQKISASKCCASPLRLFRCRFSNLPACACHCCNCSWRCRLSF